MVAEEEARPLLAEPLQHLRRALDVREDDRDRAGGPHARVDDLARDPAARPRGRTRRRRDTPLESPRPAPRRRSPWSGSRRRPPAVPGSRARRRSSTGSSTFAPGRAWRTSRVASIPSTFGIDRSIDDHVRRASVSASRAAAAPSCASPTTSSPSCRSRKRRRPPRTTAWSSAIRTRIVLGQASPPPRSSCPCPARTRSRARRRAPPPARASR